MTLKPPQAMTLTAGSRWEPARFINLNQEIKDSEMKLQELSNLLNALSSITTTTDEKGTIFDEVVGKYVIVRSRNEGINCGYVEFADGFARSSTHSLPCTKR